MTDEALFLLYFQFAKTNASYKKFNKVYMFTMNLSFVNRDGVTEESAHGIHHCSKEGRSDGKLSKFCGELSANLPNSDRFGTELFKITSDGNRRMTNI